MTDADARIDAALSALKAGKKPPCPWCGDAHCDPDADRQWACWGCRSELDVYGQDRGHACYERQLSAQAAEIERLRGVLLAIEGIALGITVECKDAHDGILALVSPEIKDVNERGEV